MPGSTRILLFFIVATIWSLFHFTLITSVPSEWFNPPGVLYNIEQYYHNALEHHLVKHLSEFRFHSFLGLSMLLLGFSQVWPVLRKRSLKLHKNLGYAYLFIGTIVNGSGLFLTRVSYGGAVTATAFSLISVSWFYFTFRGVYLALQRDIQGHGISVTQGFIMAMSVALSRAFIPLEIWSFPNLSLDVAFALAMWLSLAGGLGAAMIYARIERTKMKTNLDRNGQRRSA